MPIYNPSYYGTVIENQDLKIEIIFWICNFIILALYQKTLFNFPVTKIF